MRQTKTRKLFYKKFPYRATVYADWARVVRLYSLGNLLDNTVPNYGHYSLVIQKNKADIINALMFIKKQKKEEFKYRLEHNTLNFYFTDRSVLTEIQTIFKNTLVEFSEPDPDILTHLLSNQSSSVHKELPYDCRYKVYIKSKMNENIRQNLKKYSIKNKESIIVPNSLMEYLNSSRSTWWGNPLYFYVKDEKMLLLIQMLVSGSIRETCYMVTEEELAKEKEKHVADS